MATYVLVPGAGGDAGFWRFVEPLLRRRGHDVVAADLPAADDSAGLAEYADAVVTAIGDRRDLVLVAHSLGAFTAPLVCERVPVDLLVLVAAMVPAPGEAPGDWWANTGQVQAEREVRQAHGLDPDAPWDLGFTFLHDVPAEVAAPLAAEGWPAQSGTPFGRPWPLGAWPDVPTRFLLCQDDRLFPAEFQRRVVKERLGITPDEMPGGHLPALARPAELVEWLERYRTGVSGQ
ncbi:alpha/beta fold hydrolase [Saccharothrix syringae]|uniref:Alpha/beta fold hydrolase n=1 Tax=Saccharothrix syringae TaxID=103733 RepID=A0A5Q0H256_SACSY|nr:alpha/beta hydrolase [Saccharothrix syringae]QFZ20288.1 alpha/beta fold hydrolase [Saccharothrix syringae]